MTRTGRGLRLAAVLSVAALVLPPSGAGAQSSYAIGGGIAGGVGGLTDPGPGSDALAAQVVGVLHANSRSRPWGARLEVIGAGLAGLVDAEPTVACSPSDVPCVLAGRDPDPDRLRAAVVAATWGTRAERSGGYLIGGLGAYSLAEFRRSPWRTAPGVNGGIGASYFERRGRNHFYAEARWHRIIDGDRSVNYVIPLSVGVLF
jgi:hypothetical protein